MSYTTEISFADLFRPSLERLDIPCWADDYDEVKSFSSQSLSIVSEWPVHVMLSGLSLDLCISRSIVAITEVSIELY